MGEARRGKGWHRKLKISLQIGLQTGRGDSKGEGWEAMKSEAQQQLQLNQFGDKNSALPPLSLQ